MLPDPARRRAMTALAFRSLVQGGMLFALLLLGAVLTLGAVFGLLGALL